jgi:hypothetical protein
MTKDRSMSKATWEQLDAVIFKIRDKAASVKDHDLYGLADQANALIRQLATEILLEDQKAHSQST